MILTITRSCLGAPRLQTSPPLPDPSTVLPPRFQPRSAGSEMALLNKGRGRDSFDQQLCSKGECEGTRRPFQTHAFFTRTPIKSRDLRLTSPFPVPAPVIPSRVHSCCHSVAPDALLRHSRSPSPQRFSPTKSFPDPSTTMICRSLQ